MSDLSKNIQIYPYPILLDSLIHYYVERIDYTFVVQNNDDNKQHFKGGEQSMVLSVRTYMVMAAVAVAAVMMIQSAFAAPDPNGTKPGWGYGDNNHVHTGPPGQSVAPAR